MAAYPGDGSETEPPSDAEDVEGPPTPQPTQVRLWHFPLAWQQAGSLEHLPLRITTLLKRYGELLDDPVICPPSHPQEPITALARFATRNAALAAAEALHGLDWRDEVELQRVGGRAPEPWEQFGMEVIMPPHAAAKEVGAQMQAEAIGDPLEEAIIDEDRRPSQELTDVSDGEEDEPEVDGEDSLGAAPSAAAQGADAARMLLLAGIEEDVPQQPAELDGKDCTEVSAATAKASEVTVDAIAAAPTDASKPSEGEPGEVNGQHALEERPRCHLHRKHKPGCKFCQRYAEAQIAKEPRPAVETAPAAPGASVTLPEVAPLLSQGVSVDPLLADPTALDGAAARAVLEQDASLAGVMEIPSSLPSQESQEKSYLLLEGIPNSWSELQVQLLFTQFASVADINFVSEGSEGRSARVVLDDDLACAKAAAGLHDQFVGEPPEETFRLSCWHIVGEAEKRRRAAIEEERLRQAEISDAIHFTALAEVSHKKRLENALASLRDPTLGHKGRRMFLALFEAEKKRQEPISERRERLCMSEADDEAMEWRREIVEGERCRKAREMAAEAAETQAMALEEVESRQLEAAYIEAERQFKEQELEIEASERIAMRNADFESRSAAEELERIRKEREEAARLREERKFQAEERRRMEIAELNQRQGEAELKRREAEERSRMETAERETRRAVQAEAQRLVDEQKKKAALLEWKKKRARLTMADDDEDPAQESDDSEGEKRRKEQEKKRRQNFLEREEKARSTQGKDKGKHGGVEKSQSKVTKEKKEKEKEKDGEKEKDKVKAKEKEKAARNCLEPVKKPSASEERKARERAKKEKEEKEQQKKKEAQQKKKEEEERAQREQEELQEVEQAMQRRRNILERIRQQEEDAQRKEEEEQQRLKEEAESRKREARERQVMAEEDRRRQKMEVKERAEEKEKRRIEAIRRAKAEQQKREEEQRRQEEEARQKEAALAAEAEAKRKKAEEDLQRARLEAKQRREALIKGLLKRGRSKRSSSSSTRKSKSSKSRSSSKEEQSGSRSGSPANQQRRRRKKRLRSASNGAEPETSKVRASRRKATRRSRSRSASMPRAGRGREKGRRGHR